MSAIRSIELAIELAVRRRDAAQQQLNQAQQRLQHAKNQLLQLEDYVKETDKRLVGGSVATVSMEVLRHHYQFMERLTDAIRMQGEVVTGMLGQLKFARAELAKAETAVLGLQGVRSKRLAQLAVTVERREQARTDELAMQLHLRNMRQSAQGVQ